MPPYVREPYTFAHYPQTSDSSKNEQRQTRNGTLVLLLRNTLDATEEVSHIQPVFNIYFCGTIYMKWNLMLQSHLMFESFYDSFTHMPRPIPDAIGWNSRILISATIWTYGEGDCVELCSQLDLNVNVNLPRHIQNIATDTSQHDSTQYTQTHTFITVSSELLHLCICDPSEWISLSLLTSEGKNEEKWGKSLRGTCERRRINWYSF